MRRKPNTGPERRLATAGRGRTGRERHSDPATLGAPGLLPSRSHSLPFSKRAFP